MTPRILWCTFAAIAAASAADAKLDTAKIDRLAGIDGVWNEAEQVHKLSRPRIDVPVEVDGWTMPTFMGLTSWVAFTEGRNSEAMVAGDLVLFEDEVNPVMSAALDAGMAVTALHNHFFYDDPRVYFMHIGGEGSIAGMASAVRLVFAKQEEIRAAHPKPGNVFGRSFAPARNQINGSAMEAALRAKGQAHQGMFKVVIGREVTMPCGCVMKKEMGVNTWAAFGGTDDTAVVAGDFAVLEHELQSVLKSLRAEGINVVAIHHHMTHEKPRMLFLHYWGRGESTALARSLRRALDAQAAVPPPTHVH